MRWPQRPLAPSHTHAPPPSCPGAGRIPLLDDLERIATLHADGVLTDDEFVAAKAALLAADRHDVADPALTELALEIAVFIWASIAVGAELPLLITLFGVALIVIGIRWGTSEHAKALDVEAADRELRRDGAAGIGPKASHLVRELDLRP